MTAPTLAPAQTWTPTRKGSRAKPRIICWIGETDSGGPMVFWRQANGVWGYTQQFAEWVKAEAAVEGEGA